MNWINSKNMKNTKINHTMESIKFEFQYTARLDDLL